MGKKIDQFPMKQIFAVSFKTQKHLWISVKDGLTINLTKI